MEDEALVVEEPSGVVVAVFDGLGGHDRGEDASWAAKAAVEEYGVLESTRDAVEVLRAANRAVWNLIKHDDHISVWNPVGFAKNGPGLDEPQSTAAVISWSEQHGLFAAWVGDSIVFATALRERVAGWHGAPQGVWGSPFVGWTLGAVEELSERDIMCMDPWEKERLDSEMYEHGLLVGAASDGLFEPLMKSHYGDKGIYHGLSQDPSDNSLGFALPLDVRANADSAAEFLLVSSAKAGFSDNAAVAVAVVHPHW